MGMGSYNTKIQQLNAAIPSWAAGLNKTESPIWVVDQYTGFASSDLRDGVHPNASGDQKMVNVWYPAVVKAFAAAKAEQGTSMAVEFVA
jgi:lysophospholipase L1-like esterase